MRAARYTGRAFQKWGTAKSLAANRPEYRMSRILFSTGAPGLFRWGNSGELKIGSLASDQRLP